MREMFFAVYFYSRPIYCMKVFIDMYVGVNGRSSFTCSGPSTITDNSLFEADNIRKDKDNFVKSNKKLRPITWRINKVANGLRFETLLKT